MAFVEFGKDEIGTALTDEERVIYSRACILKCWFSRRVHTNEYQLCAMYYQMSSVYTVYTCSCVLC